MNIKTNHQLTMAKTALASTANLDHHVISNKELIKRKGNLAIVLNAHRNVPYYELGTGTGSGSGSGSGTGSGSGSGSGAS